ncbi:[protein-PII] uridylyltransferase [Agaribacterium haliotis]|uniref:[protein-PII] uridylyltransferase n=1 Tax=Agaribacterium haliotis TaxID=2013869 RepID=UPI000BB52E70|nr:[protein-PII] uridylyltransferase [Agaribacterium haliotis]
MHVDTIPHYACQPLSFNQKQFRQKLRSSAPIQAFKDAISGMNSHFEMRFREGGNIRSLIEERAAFIDVVLHYAWYSHRWDDDACLMAVGGYGRGELHPHSDIDILILFGNQVGDKYNEQLQALVTFLWDIGLEIGSSVRSIEQCIDIAEQDITVATNLLESRRIAGNDALRDQLQRATGPEQMWPLKAFFKAKWAEQVERHNKHNNTECNLEPNIKNAPGGLRDLQMINWVAKRYFGVRTLRELEGQDFFTEREFAMLRAAEEFLWAVRFGLHLISGRAEERLLFEYQRELARLFGYEDNELSLGVERFMHKYYRIVISLRELNDVLLGWLDEKINYRDGQHKIQPLNERFQLHDNYIEVVHSKVFDLHPSALLEVFVLMGNNPSISGIRASTIRLIREKRVLIDDKFRQDALNKAMFLQIFSISYGLVTQLGRMKRYGVLGRYLPAFGKITGQMQHDLFHRYTVDAHTLLVIRNMRRFTQPAEEKQFPIAATILRHLPKPELLYIAGLFHDIAKGRGGDHSELGAIDALEFCQSHGLSGKESRLVAWLVEKHLLMSYVSQKKDISDPDVIRDFAIAVGDQGRLDHLFALTVADMCATNPEVWNTWRASLMRQLYTETKRALRLGLENTVDKQELIEETQSKALAALTARGISEKQAWQFWQDMGDEYFIRENHVDIANQTEALSKHNSPAPLILISETTDRKLEGATQIFIWARDARHVFIAATTCLAQQGLNIQDAKIYQSASGHTLDTFYVLNENFEFLGNDSERYQKIHDALQQELALIGEYSDIVKRRTPRELKQFSTPTSTSMSNDIVSGYTVLEVISPDRPGFLATIAQAFMEEDIIVHNARITTLGERVEDVFFITDVDGNALSDVERCAELQDKIRRRLDRQVRKELAS